MEYVIRSLVGGIVVSVFSMLGDVLRPRASRGCSGPHHPSHWRRSVSPYTCTAGLRDRAFCIAGVDAVGQRRRPRFGSGRRRQHLSPSPIPILWEPSLLREFSLEIRSALIELSD